MNNTLNRILKKIAADHQSHIAIGARHYKEVDISQTAVDLGLTEAEARYRNVKAIVPLKTPVKGMKVRVDGRTFVNYVQFESGVALPGHVADRSDLPRSDFVVQDSMILNVA